MLLKRVSRSIVCKKLQDDILGFCLFNPFRLSKALLNLYFKYYFYRSINFNFHKKFKIFYKKTITTFGKNRFLSYFMKIKVLKKKLMFFFGYNSFKQLAFLFNNIYNKKSIFNFFSLLIFLEMRLDFLLYRLRVGFSLFEVRNLIYFYGVLINYISYKNFNYHLIIGDYIQFNNFFKFNFFLKLYRFWFNEYI